MNVAQVSDETSGLSRTSIQHRRTMTTAIRAEDDEDQCAKIMVSVDPVIDLELIKLVNGQDANDMASAVTVMPGDVVTWTITTTVTNAADDRHGDRQ